MWELINFDDPTAPQSWLQVAVDLANEGALDSAVTMASNALHLVGSRHEVAEEVLTLLGELYEALGRRWHQALMARERAVRQQAVPRSGRRR